jgi:hypothetical protein
MAHYKHYNFPAFDAARDLLYRRYRSDTITVVSPADLDRQNGFDETKGDPNNTPPKVIHEAMRRDIEALLTCDKVVVLDKWEHSNGACLEVAIAKALGVPVETLDGISVL